MNGRPAVLPALLQQMGQAQLAPSRLRSGEPEPQSLTRITQNLLKELREPPLWDLSLLKGDLDILGQPKSERGYLVGTKAKASDVGLSPQWPL